MPGATEKPVLADSHCHLQMLDDPPAKVVARAVEAGVGQLLCVAVEPSDLERILPICDSFPEVSASVGLHPNYESKSEPSAEYLASLAEDKRIVAIGETGLDCFRTNIDADRQKQRLAEHVRAARGCGKPLIIHCRDAWDETIDLLTNENANEVGGVMHCFTGNLSNAKRAMDIGFMISFSGIVTFKNAENLRQVAKDIPLDMLLLETDCPYLAPEPHRGKANEPAMVVHTAQRLASIKGLELVELAEHTSANYNKLFLQ